MEVAEENPFKIEKNVSNSASNRSTNHRNCAGRPTKKNEIKFSQPPKSVISILLSKKNNINNEHEISGSIIKTTTCEKDNERTQNLREGNDYDPQKEDVYRCKHSNCTYSTKFPSNLKTHKRIHTNEQPYICDKCTFRTKFISSLKTHKRLHKDEKPFACQDCDYKCNSSSNLKKHIARKHS